MKKILFFDTETTGLFKGNPKVDKTNFHTFPRIVQFGCILTDFDGNDIKQENVVVKADFDIPRDKFLVENNITNERCAEHGTHSPKELIQLVADLMNEADLLVAHNMNYDSKIVSAEMFRHDVFPNKKIQKVCTMMASNNVVKAKKKDGSAKLPNLQELHTHLFGEGFSGAHDAMVDISVTKKCFFELVSRGVITL